MVKMNNGMKNIQRMKCRIFKWQNKVQLQYRWHFALYIFTSCIDIWSIIDTLGPVHLKDISHRCMSMMINQVLFPHSDLIYDRIFLLSSLEQFNHPSPFNVLAEKYTLNWTTIDACLDDASTDNVLSGSINLCGDQLAISISNRLIHHPRRQRE